MRLTSISRIFSGVRVYVMVWLLWISSSKFRATLSARVGICSSEVLIGFNLVDELEEPEVCVCR
jgi:hypothetical protein